jgi:hypothetical protein
MGLSLLLSLVGCWLEKIRIITAVKMSHQYLGFLKFTEGGITHYANTIYSLVHYSLVLFITSDKEGRKKEKPRARVIRCDR